MSEFWCHMITFFTKVTIFGVWGGRFCSSRRHGQSVKLTNEPTLILEVNSVSCKKINKSASGLEQWNLGITKGWSCVQSTAGAGISTPAATNQFIYPLFNTPAVTSFTLQKYDPLLPLSEQILSRFSTFYWLNWLSVEIFYINVLL